MSDTITVRGAREHNLKNIDLDLPRDKLIVITGLSGSGKSSLAFDTIYAEGQRRYVESLSAYARQFLDMMQKPDGVTVAQMGTKTGWQPHSVRAALTGLRKRGIAIARERSDAGVTVYRIGAA